MSNLSKPQRALYAITGLGLQVYGLKTILVQEISAAGGNLRGAAWVIRGEPAALLGFLVGMLGAYIFFLSFKR